MFVFSVTLSLLELDTTKYTFSEHFCEMNISNDVIVVVKEVKSFDSFPFYVFFGELAFSHAGPALWNSLQVSIQASTNTASFCRLLKTHF